MVATALNSNSLQKATQTSQNFAKTITAGHISIVAREVRERIHRLKRRWDGRIHDRWRHWRQLAIVGDDCESHQMPALFKSVVSHS